MKQHIGVLTRTLIVAVLAVTLAVCAVFSAVPSVAGAATGWSKTYGGTGNETSTWFFQTTDGGYAMAGMTNSFGAGGLDMFLIKTDANGNTQWNKTYGGNRTDYGRAAVQTVDGGYLMAGMTNSFGAGSYDGWLVKTDSSGNMQWNKTYGGPLGEALVRPVQTSDGGYAVHGAVYISPTLYVPWILKIDANGNTQWNQTYAFPSSSHYGFRQTADGGYAIAGNTNSSAGDNDMLLVKTDSSGNMQWNKTYGGTGDEWGGMFVQTTDGGYVIPGYTNSSGAGGYDGWLVKTDANGKMQWNKTYGGTGNDQFNRLTQTLDGSFAIIGMTNSYGAGDYDVWLVKTDSYGNMQWSKTFGGSGSDGSSGSVLQTSDGGYTILSGTASFGAGGTDFYLVKTDENGNTPPPPATSAFCSVTVMRGWTWYFFAHSNGGVGAHTYQWYENTTLLQGQTSMVLPVTKTAAGTYTFICKVTDAQGLTVNSNTVTLTVMS